MKKTIEKLKKYAKSKQKLMALLQQAATMSSTILKSWGYFVLPTCFSYFWLGSYQMKNRMAKKIIYCFSPEVVYT